MGGCYDCFNEHIRLFGDDMKESKYLLLFEKIRADRALNVRETVELIAVALGKSPETVKSYMNKGCPSVSLKFLEMHFKKELLE